MDNFGLKTGYVTEEQTIAKAVEYPFPSIESNKTHGKMIWDIEKYYGYKNRNKSTLETDLINKRMEDYKKASVSKDEELSDVNRVKVCVDVKKHLEMQKKLHKHNERRTW